MLGLCSGDSGCLTPRNGIPSFMSSKLYTDGWNLNLKDIRRRMANFRNLEMSLFVPIIPFCLLGLISNILVVRIVHKTREMHTTTNYLLANLAVSDVIIIFTIPVHFASFSQFTCKFKVIGDIAIASSVLTLLLMAVERYHALLKPFRSNLRLNEENIKKAIAFIWALSTVLGFPEFFLNEWNNDYHNKKNYCAACNGPWGFDPNLASKIYLIIYSIFTVYIPITVFLFCYGSLIKGLNFSNAICAESTNEDNSEKKKLLTTFILATSGFLLGYGPIAVFHTMTSFGKKIDCFLFIKVDLIFSFPLEMSFCLNPILYAFRSSSFKEGFKKLFLPCSSQTVEQNAT
ncbi:mu-type opioid receptor-like isoform X1 [Acropora palmata]|uniref:mu-type opioid receptor-like isoform X1 n=1 Tax=Acropora palmata TaxID=6131 RepID=UPI003DA0BF7D